MISLLILFFLVSIVFSFLCSLWEAVLLSITPSYAEIQYQEGTRIGEHLRAFKENIDRPLAAILTLNTIAHTAGAIGVGAQASLIWADSNPLITGLLVPVVMTLAILVLSEIIPKTIGATHWQKLAPFTVNALLMIITLLYPFVWLSRFLTSLLKKDAQGSIFSRSDFVTMAQIGEREGIFEPGESEIIGNLLRFNEVTAQDIMTPRTVVFAAPGSQSIQTFLDGNKQLAFSRIPIHDDESIDHVIGYVLKNELLAAMLEARGEDDLASLRREVVVVSGTLPLPELFNRFVSGREHIALVVDEFGGMAGIVTMEDVVETLLGLEIVDESDSDADMQALARQSWETRAKAHGLIPEQRSSTPNGEPDASN